MSVKESNYHVKQLIVSTDAEGNPNGIGVRQGLIGFEDLTSFDTATKVMGPSEMVVGVGMDIPFLYSPNDASADYMVRGQKPFQESGK